MQVVDEISQVGAENVGGLGGKGLKKQENCEKDLLTQQGLGGEGKQL